MKILHTYCLNYNIGDYLLGIGAKYILRESFDVSLISEVNIQGTVFNDYFIEQMNRKYDLLVIGGGGIIHGSHWPNGWFWLIEKENIKKIKIPFIVYGVGYNYFRGETGIPEKGISHLKETFKRALFFSVRNDESKERLRDQTGIIATEIADPGFWTVLSDNKEKPMDSKYVIVQLANDKPEFRFHSKEKKNKFKKEIRIIIEKLSEDYKVIMAPHVFDDIELCKDVISGLKNTNIWDFGKYAFDRSFETIKYYKHAEFVLSMRGHGQIVPLGENIPVISLENHDKNIGLMKKMSLEEYNVNIFDEQLIEKVLGIVDLIKRNKSELKNKIKIINKGLLNHTFKEFSELNTKIK